ncbi:MAG: hypothetical protein K2P65_00425 [Lachnospiraceae bacterium]|nr:hypothetical protein [Lachnospiraceae bacterium]
MTKTLQQAAICKETPCQAIPIRKGHTTFGGKIYLSDFNTDYRGKPKAGGSAIASRIAQDAKFDEQCRRNANGLKGEGSI